MLFNVNHISQGFTHCYLVGVIETLISVQLLLLLLLIAGDIHPNPGPIAQQGYSICHINARSITAANRLEQIEAFIKTENNFDIVAISETHIDHTVCDSRINIDQYVVHRRDRNRNGGGVCIYIHEELSSIRRLDLEHHNLEMVWVEVRLGT